MKQRRKNSEFLRFSRSLGLEIRRCREKKGWVLEEVEDHGDIQWRHLQKIETGKNPNITLETLFSICKLLKIQPAELFKHVEI